MPAATGKIQLTGVCSAAPDDSTIAFPAGANPPSGHLLVTGNGTDRVMRAAIRSGAGNAACVSGSVLAAFGGETAEVGYREIGTLGRLRRDSSLRLQFAIAVLTVVGALIAATSAFIKSSAATATAFEQKFAAVVFAIAAVLAVLKFLKELKDL